MTKAQDFLNSISETIPAMTTAEWAASLTDCPTCFGPNPSDDPADCPQCHGDRWI